MTFVCAVDFNLDYILGFAPHSSSWNFKYMTVSNLWILRLFKKSFWNKHDDALIKIPFQPVLADFAGDGGSLKEEEEIDVEKDVDEKSLQESPIKRKRKDYRDVIIGKSPIRRKNHERLEFTGTKKCGGDRAREKNTIQIPLLLSSLNLSSHSSLQIIQQLVPSAKQPKSWLRP